MRVQFEQTAETLPTGILTCMINGEEAGIQEFSPSHIQIRLPDKLAVEIEETVIRYYSLKERKYHSLPLKKILWQNPVEKEFWWEYSGIVKDEEYKNVIFFIMKQYYDYILLKTQSTDSEAAEALIGYPAAEDEIFDGDYSVWRKEQERLIEDAALTDFLLKLDVELAISLDNQLCYEAFIRGELENVVDRRIVQKADRVYIGNSFCHHLFPEKRLLFAILEKARENRKKVTLVFTCLREELLEETAQLLDEIYEWCKKHQILTEIVVNDWGMLPMLEEKKDFFVLSYGILLNKRRKDPRYVYKNRNQTDWMTLEENAGNVKEYREFLKMWGFSRYEYESGGSCIKLPEESGCVSIHVPMYQTNTSQYCTLRAICENQDRSRQKFFYQCPKYCSAYVCMYPKHLHMIGRYNSLLAVDMRILKNSGILREYKKTGMDRIVWNLV